MFKNYYSPFFVLVLFFIPFLGFSQSIGINTDGSQPDASAILDVKSSAKGILIPRMTTGQRNGIASPAEGLLVFDSDIGSFWFYQNGIWQEIQTTNSAVFQRSVNVVRTGTGFGTDDFVFGRSDLPPTTSIVDTLFFFDHSKAAFRGGSITNTRWAPANLGAHSFAYGRNAEASGYGSVAMGDGVRATNTGSVAIGYDINVTGESSVALGYVSGASGDFGALAVGYESYAQGNTSIALGLEAVARGDHSVAIGQNVEAEGDIGAVSLGYGSVANGNSGTVLGTYNDPIVAVGNPYTSTSPTLIVGNGTKNTIRSNAMVILKNGKTGLGTNTPRERLELDGAIIVGNHSSTTPVDGTIRYTGNDLEGYIKGNWESLSFDTDNNPTNELQTLSVSGNLLSISSGNTVTLPSSGGGGDEITDADGDTKVQVEESADEDIIRFDLAGEEKLILKESNNGRARLEFGSTNNNNLLIGENTGNNLSANSAVGFSNIFIGQQSGEATTNGRFNTFLGNESGKANQLGTNNTYLGYKAGIVNSSGTSNVFIGSNAGIGNTSGSGNVFIGSSVSILHGASDRLAIHNASSNENTALIYGEFANQMLRVNGELQVQGDLNVQAQLEINQNYRFPTTAGADGQVLVTDANGDLSWQHISGSTNGSLPPPSQTYSTPGSSTGGFGTTVSKYGDHIVVGAPLDNYLPVLNGYGVAYYYDKDTYGWKMDSRITSNDPSNSQYGQSVDIDVDNMVVGAKSSTPNGLGKVFYFSYTPGNTPSLLTDFQSSDISANDFFGEAVALSGNYVAVGAPAKNSSQGRAYVFEYNGSTFIQRANLAVSGSGQLGAALDIDGDYLVVGAFATAGGGKVHVYVRSGTSWILQQTFSPPSGSGYGSGVAIDGSKIAIGASSGQYVEIWERSGSTWSLEQTVTALDSRVQDGFGTAVSIEGNKLVVGAPNVDYNGNNRGAVYSYEFDGTTWNFKKKHLHPNGQGNDSIGRSVKIEGTQFVAGGSGQIFIQDF